MTVLQSFSPEVCSLICQDPILERLDLYSICFISHAFRNEAQREISFRFPCLRGVMRVKAWCLSLQSSPHIATNVKGLVLLLPETPALGNDHIERLRQALHMCVNLKELVVLFQERHLRRPGLQEPKYSSSSNHILCDHPFKLTKFVNGYFSQDDVFFNMFLEDEWCLESLELLTGGEADFYLPNPLKSLACSAKYLASYWRSPFKLPARLRILFENSLDYHDREIKEFLRYNMKMTSLAIFSKQKKIHFSKIMSAIMRKHINIRHIEIHQFFPTQVSPSTLRNRMKNVMCDDEFRLRNIFPFLSSLAMV